MKPEDVKIISISTALSPMGSVNVYGLGDNGMVYTWNPQQHIWHIF
jgi:hypothetical protein